jgi:hypothetical protein
LVGVKINQYPRVRGCISLKKRTKKAGKFPRRGKLKRSNITSVIALVFLQPYLFSLSHTHIYSTS